MSHVSRGKAFEEEIRKAFEREPNTSVTRLIDPQNGYAGVRNICDFIVYKRPSQFFIECKSHYGNTLNFKGDITENQWNGMLEMSKVDGVVAGIIVWFIDHDKTVFIPIERLEFYKQQGYKSVNINKMWDTDWVLIEGKKKRIMYEYDMASFFANFC